MASIFVTFPRKRKNAQRLRPRIEHYRENVEGREYFVFKIGNRLPTRAGRGDRCYVGFDGRVQGYMRLLRARYVPAAEAATFGDWDGSDGNFLFCDFDSFHELDDKRSYARGFRGFRYFEDETRC
jgi:hypothetical protein